MRVGQYPGANRRREERSRRRRSVPSHGPGYSFGCRCDECTDWNMLRQRRVYQRKRGDLAPYESPGRTHGIRATYKSGCRCEDCRRAEREYRADYRRRAG